MSDLVFWLNANPNAVSGFASAVSAIATVVLAITTIVYAWHTSQLAKENRLLRRAGTDPQVVAYATLNPRVFGAIDFVIANIGKGPAQNVSFEILSGGEDFSSKGVRLPHRGARFTFLPQGDQISTFLGMGHELIGNPSLAPFKVEVRYEEVLGAKHVAQFDVNISQFEGLVRLGKSADEEIAESVKKIADEMGKWSRSRLPVETISTHERELQDEEHRKQVREHLERRRQNRETVPPADSDTSKEKGTDK